MAFHLGSLGFLTPFEFDNFEEQVTNVLEGKLPPPSQTAVTYINCHWWCRWIIELQLTGILITFSYLPSWKRFSIRLIKLAEMMLSVEEIVELKVLMSNWMQVMQLLLFAVVCAVLSYVKTKPPAKQPKRRPVCWFSTRWSSTVALRPTSLTSISISTASTSLQSKEMVIAFKWIRKRKVNNEGTNNCDSNPSIE